MNHLTNNLEKDPLISVIIPVYNASRYITETINSVLEQTYQNFEIIAVDDGSKDNSIEVLGNINDGRIHILKQKNSGAAIARQNGLNYAKGEYIQFLDADDIISPDKFLTQLAALRGNPGMISICKTSHFYDGDDYLLQSVADDDTFFTEYLKEPVKFLIKLYGGFDLKGGMIQPNAFLVPIDVLRAAGPWSNELSPCPDDDGEYFCRVILHSSGIIYINNTLNYYRKFRTNQSLSRQTSEFALRKIFLAYQMKHRHLLRFADSNLHPYISTATNRLINELKMRAYIYYPKLYKDIYQFQNQLTPHLKPTSHTYGGPIMNFLGNRISWKLVKRLQSLKGKFKTG